MQTMKSAHGPASPCPTIWHAPHAFRIPIPPYSLDVKETLKPK